MNAFKHLIIWILKVVLKSFFYLFPVKENKILFINFNGKGYGCNPKYIANEILNQKLPYDLVWSLSNINEPLPEGIRPVHHARSFHYYYEIATAKVIVTNVKNDLGLFKKKGQYIIQTWHGSMGGKRAEGDALNTLTKSYIKESKQNSKQTDLFLSNSRAMSSYYRKAFWCRCEILECGSPRNDILFFDKTPINIRARAFLGIPENARIALYAPTFRDDNSFDAYTFNTERVLSAFQEQGGDWVMLIRMHPNAQKFAENFTYTKNIIDATAYPDMQELLLICDALITDYSSTVFEIAVMKKALYLYVTDFENFNSTRGLLPEFLNMPYPFNKNEDELIETISNDTQKSIKSNAEAFIKNFGCTDNGTASKQVTERIKKIIGIKP